MATYEFSYQHYSAEINAPSIKDAVKAFLGPNRLNDVASGFWVGGPEGSFYFQDDDGDECVPWDHYFPNDPLYPDLSGPRVVAFALAGGVSIISVHPSVDDAIASSGREVKRDSLSGAVLKARPDEPGVPDGDNGGYYIAPVNIAPSEIYDGLWCQSGAEGDDTNAYLQQASSYFPEEAWMLSQE